jgi:mRNA interferase MazF
MPNQKDIVLINIPFSNLKSSKKRPVLIISNDEYNKKQEDIIVAAITSNLTSKDYTVEFDNGNMARGTIPQKSCIRADKIYTLDKKLIIKTFGSVSDDILNKTAEMLEKVIAKCEK